jgi:hypothetical protein
MSRTCGACKGRGWFGPRTALFGDKGGSTCRACGGSGVDDRWCETSCKHCGTAIEYRRDWSHVPEYCKSCSQMLSKSCATPGCFGTINYKAYWDHVPDYCESCRKPQYKPCKNPDCSGQVRYFAFWGRIPDYCDSCKGWRIKGCRDCGKEIKYHNDWNHPPNYCQDCKFLKGKSIDVTGGIHRTPQQTIEANLLWEGASGKGVGCHQDPNNIK